MTLDYELRQERQRAYAAALRDRLLEVGRAEAGALISLSLHLATASEA